MKKKETRVYKQLQINTLITQLVWRNNKNATRGTKQTMYLQMSNQ